MDKPKPPNETPDDTPINQDLADSSDANGTVGTAQSSDLASSTELAIETLAGVDAAEAPDLADELAGALRAALSDS